jgi:uncharacterized protein GlcG (DUF336 family)
VPKAGWTLGLIHLTNVIANQGGALPIKVGDEVIGAAGASGAPGGEKDEACVKAGSLRRRPGSSLSSGR